MKIGRDYLRCTDSESTRMILDTADPLLHSEIVTATRKEMLTQVLSIKPSSSKWSLRAQVLYEFGQTMPEMPDRKRLDAISAETQDLQEIIWRRLATEGDIGPFLSNELAKPVAAHFARTAFSCLKIARGLNIATDVNVNDRPELMRRWMSFSASSDAAKRYHNTIRYANLQSSAYKSLGTALYLAKNFGFSLDDAQAEAAARSSR